jgi:hypothetical protein
MAAKQKIEGALYPDEVALAAAAFQGALAALDGAIQADPHSVRRCLAEYISAHALMGELDVNVLRDGALSYVRNGFMRPAAVATEVIVLREESSKPLRI